MVTIYGLIDPRNNELKYVGKTVKSLSVRLSAHISESKRDGKSKRDRWVNKLSSLKLRPEIFVIETVESDSWKDAEKFWISYFKSLGCDLVNFLEGGDEPPVLYGKNNPNYEKGYLVSNEEREVRSKRFKGVKLEGEQLKSVKLTHQRNKNNPDFSKNISDAHFKKLGYRVVVTYPNGVEECVINLSEFCRDNNLTRSRVNDTMNGKATSTKGFKFRKVNYNG